MKQDKMVLPPSQITIRPKMNSNLGRREYVRAPNICICLFKQELLCVLHQKIAVSAKSLDGSVPEQTWHSLALKAKQCRNSFGLAYI